MNISKVSLAGLMLAAVAALSACGGGESVPAQVQSFVSRIDAGAPSSSRLHALAASGGGSSSLAAGQITNAQLFAWAQGRYPEYFGTTPPQQFTIPYQGKVFDVRAYATGNYLGVADGVAYGLGPFTGEVLVSFGNVADFTCTVDPSICNPPPPAGSLNECVDPAWASLPAGFRISLVYALSGGTGGQMSEDTVVDGLGFAFEGKTATQVTTTSHTSFSVLGTTFQSDAVTKTYHQIGSNGLLLELGELVDTRSDPIVINGVEVRPGSASTTKTVYDPPDPFTEFTLAIGQSVTKNAPYTTTPINPAGPPSTGVNRETYTYEARESVTLQNGKSYDTCRYKTNDAGDESKMWLLVGKGVMVKSEAMQDGQPVVLELTSGAYGGQGL